MTVPNWLSVEDLEALITPDKLPSDIEWSANRALREFATIATIPEHPTDEQVEYLQSAVVAYIEWQSDTGGSSAHEIQIGHVRVDSGNASERGAVPLPSAVWAHLRAAGVLRVARARAY